MERILVTGADGRLGRALCADLRLRHGCGAVIACDLKPDELRPDGPYRGLNVLDRTSLFSLVSREQITAIYHLAAELVGASERHPGKAWDTNLGGLVNVLDAAKLYGCRVFWPGSIAVFGPEAPREHCPQDTITKPRTIYGMSKLAGELRIAYYTDKFGIDVRCLRLPGLVVPGAEPRGGMMDLVHAAPAAARQNLPYTSYLKPTTRLSAMHLDAAVAAINQLMTAGPADRLSGIAYNINTVSFSPAELELLLCKQYPGFRLSYQSDPRQALATGWPASFDDRAARRDWGYAHTGTLNELIDAAGN